MEKGRIQILLTTKSNTKVNAVEQNVPTDYTDASPIRELHGINKIIDTFEKSSVTGKDADKYFF